MRGSVSISLVALLGLGGCNVQKSLWQAGIPGLATPLVVSRSTPVAGYLEAELMGGDMHLDTFTPASEDCAAVLQPEAAVDYVADGPYGVFRRGDRTCQAVGLGSLREWRDRRPSQTTVVMLPRAQADFRVWYEDEKQVLLRGRFPLGSLLGFTGLDDSIVVVPNIPVCRKPVRDGVASMQYYQTGEHPLVLLSGDGQCPITALLQPLPESGIQQW